MKNLLYIIAGLLLVIWFIVFLSFNSSNLVHILLIAAGLVILIRIFLTRQNSKKTGKKLSFHNNP